MEYDTVKNQPDDINVRKLLYTKLNSRYLILAVNAYCVSLIHYSGGIVSWSQADLYKLNVTMRKQFTMHGRNSDINRLWKRPDLC